MPFAMLEDAEIDRRPLACEVVLRSAPLRCSIEHFLSTEKSYGVYHHEMRVSSMSQGHYTSISSGRSHSEYTIWRSWEDCLALQELLEELYERAAREKKRRLAQGKGVKGFNGVYKKDLASSWESLPSGPHPNSVVQDIHGYLPTLSRRSTVFRPSQATIERRHAELILFVTTLFSDDMPTLIKEIRDSSDISNFFGFLRRDLELVEAARKHKKVPRSSLSIFSSYFSASHPSLLSPDAAPRNSTPTYKKSQYSTPETTEEPRYSRRSRSRPLSSSSDSSARSGSSSDSSSSSSTGPAIADDVPIVFGHNPSNPSDQSELPEEQELSSKSSEPYRQGPRPRASAMERKARRSYSIFGLSRQEGSLSSEKLDNRSVRESWQTVDSLNSTANDLLDGLGLALPHPIKEEKFRASIASISTFMTTDSADAVIPQTPGGEKTPQQSSFRSNLRISTPLSISVFDVYSDTDDDLSVLDPIQHLISSIPERPESRPQTPETPGVGDLSLPPSPNPTRTAFTRTLSRMCSAASCTTTTSTLSPADSISIKAIHDTCIIFLRVSRGLGFAEVRQHLYNKFIGQEGIPLSQAYKVAVVPPSDAPAGPCSTDDQLITLESDWEQLVSSTLHGSKITLRILDVPAP